MRVKGSPGRRWRGSGRAHLDLDTVRGPTHFHPAGNKRLGLWHAARGFRGRARARQAACGTWGPSGGTPGLAGPRGSPRRHCRRLRFRRCRRGCWLRRRGPRRIHSLPPGPLPQASACVCGHSRSARRPCVHHPCRAQAPVTPRAPPSPVTPPELLVRAGPMPRLISPRWLGAPDDLPGAGSLVPAARGRAGSLVPAARCAEPAPLDCGLVDRLTRSPCAFRGEASNCCAKRWRCRRPRVQGALICLWRCHVFLAEAPAAVETSAAVAAAGVASAAPDTSPRAAAGLDGPAGAAEVVAAAESVGHAEAEAACGMAAAGE